MVLNIYLYIDFFITVIHIRCIVNYQMIRHLINVFQPPLDIIGLMIQVTTIATNKFLQKPLIQITQTHTVIQI